jgi:photosystem II stability/assembly factor-like uncharacterized protein
VFDLVLDPSSPVASRTIYAASYSQGINKSIDGGRSWSAINEGIGPDDDFFARSIAIDPYDPWVLYAGFDQGGRLYNSSDGGQSWHELPGNFHDVTEILIDPQDSQTLYVGSLGFWDEVEQVVRESSV